MVFKRDKKIELRKRKETDKEKRTKERQKKRKETKEVIENLRLNLTILFLIGVNFLFVSSFVCQSLKNQGTEGALTSTDLEGFSFERPPAQDFKVEEIPFDNVPQKLKVEVLNGCGTPGIAKDLTDYLRRNEFDVVYYGNFENQSINETLVIDRRDARLKNAKIIGNAIGVQEDRMFPQISPQRQLDVTIIIGKNYPQLKAFR